MTFIHIVKLMIKLNKLTIDWQEVTEDLIKRFIRSICPLKKLIIYMQSHNCINANHPTKSLWYELESSKKTEITLVFWSGIHPDMICPSSRLIYPVVCHKLIECTYVDTNYSMLLTAHKDCLRNQIFCCLNRDCVYLENSEELWESAIQCKNLENIVIIGHYLIPSSIRAIATAFAPHLKHYLIADTCITKDSDDNLMDSYAHISDEELAVLASDVSKKLERRWKPLRKESLPKEIDYFIDDNDEYLFGTVQKRKRILNI
ncbi:DgyrCDS3043 [Dimorphilus gyrociliatus]|uniref:DgyrCDS3043 n=1 Tax=Dimorphilus gyrociliatus TaxID=2664684 RepID=A0A7I8VF21_9ANNE|nr:DgyrCDS3043 [Dimorphilus gyrociliatus]